MNTPITSEPPESDQNKQDFKAFYAERRQLPPGYWQTLPLMRPSMPSSENEVLNPSKPPLSSESNPLDLNKLLGSTSMDHIHTHYDNLKVARNAPHEVIRAAYKTLSQKFHPDRNPGNAEAARIMAIINTSYDVLSDPDKRHEHDLWVAQQELIAEQAAKMNGPTQRQTPTQPQPPPRSSIGGIVAHVLRYWVLYGVAGFFIWILAKSGKKGTDLFSDSFS